MHDRRRNWAAILRSAALVAILVLAQTAAIVHADREDAHAPDQVCALCVGLATLGSGGVPATLDVAVTIQRPLHIDDTDVQTCAHCIDHRFARGPPLIS